MRDILLKLRRYRILISLAVAANGAASSQASASDSIRYDIRSLATLSSGEYTPFWLVSNLQGLGSPKKNYGFVKGALIKKIDEDRRFSWGAGVDLAASWNTASAFQIHQLYGQIKYRAFDLVAGSKEMWCDYNNPRLSSGSLLYSGNALPVPQIRAGIFDFTPIPGMKKRVAVKAYIAYGFFTDSEWQKSWVEEGTKYSTDVLYHSKGLWLRFGNPETSPVTGDIGIEMGTQFGGTSYKDGKKVSMRPGLEGWIKTLFPSFKTHATFNGHTRSIEGNVIGEYTFNLSYAPLKQDWSLRWYYEHMFEDHSMLTFEYGWYDGLLGFEAALPKNPWVSSVVYEFLYTKYQAGAVNQDKNTSIPEQVSGRDDYYNHSFYPGWQHWGMGIGNPLLISPIYNTNHNIYFYTNRIIGHHLGIGGNPTAGLDYRILLSYTRNWGTYDRPLPDVLHNFSGLFEINWRPNKLKGWYGGVSLAFDNGDLLGKSLGFGITIGKAGSIRL